jgi:hypothetical protein
MYARYALLVLAFIILVYIVVLMGADHPVPVIGGVAIAGYYILEFIFKKEKMTSIMDSSDMSSDVVQNGNIAFNRDYDLMTGGELNRIDPRLQRQYGMPVGEDDSYIDNSDVVEQSISGGDSVFQPMMQGSSATSAGQLGNFAMGRPGRSVLHDIPQTNLASADELVARKQAHNLDLSRRAIEGAVRSTRNKFDKYFQNELAECEGLVWWSAEASEADTDYEVPY